MQADKLNRVSQLILGKLPEEALDLLGKEFAEKIVFSTSFGLEDQAITHIIFSKKIPIKIFTLDTGRLFAETYFAWSRTREKYGKNIEAFYPKEEATQQMVSQKGPNSFYESVENRLQCCYIRKVEPLQRALQGNAIWIAGIRKEQSANRNNLASVEWDDKHQLIKFYPLFHWSFEHLKKYIKENDIPYNSLHDKGFPSIGCQPCTRAVKDGEDARSGRWWWEDTAKKECGLHIKPKTKNYL